MAEPVWQFRLSVGNEPLFSVPVRTQGCQTLPNAHPWASHPIALGFSGTGLEAQSSQTDAVKSLIRWESPHPLSIAGVSIVRLLGGASGNLGLREDGGIDGAGGRNNDGWYDDTSDGRVTARMIQGWHRNRARPAGADSMGPVHGA